MREPTWTQNLARPARMRLESVPQPLRAMAREQSADEVLLEAELPWLTLGAQVATELDGHVQHGRVRWVGLDVTRRGAARLRILVGPADGPALPPPDHTGQMAPLGQEPLVKPLRRRHPASWLALLGCAFVIAAAIWMWPAPRMSRLATNEPADQAARRTPVAITIPQAHAQAQAQAPRLPEPPRRLRARMRKLSRLY